MRTPESPRLRRSSSTTRPRWRGDVCTIEGESAAEPLLQAVYEEVLKAGGNPIVHMAMEGQSAAYFEHASDAQLEWISPVAEWAVENADVRIAVMASQNTRALSTVPPERQAKRQAATHGLMKRAMERSAEGTYRWALTLFPTHAYASEAGLNLAAFEDFYYGACLATDDDPVAAWKRQSEETERLAEWIEGRREVHVHGQGTDLRIGIEDATSSPRAASTTCPTASSSRARSRTRPRARSPSTFPPHTRPGGRRRQVPLRGRQGGGRLGGEGRGLPDRDARHRRRRTPPRRARSGPTTGSPMGPERSSSTRRSAAPSTSRSGAPIRDRRGERVGDPLGHDL